MDPLTHLLKGCLPAKIFLPPGDPDVCQLRHFRRVLAFLSACGTTRGDHCERGRAGGVECKIGLDFAQFRGCQLTSYLKKANPIPACSTAQRALMRPMSGDPEGDAWMLHRNRQETRLGDLVIFPLVTEGFSTPQLDQDFQPFIKHLSMPLRIRRFPEATEFSTTIRPDSQAQNHTPTREVIKRHA